MNLKRALRGIKKFFFGSASKVETEPDYYDRPEVQAAIVEAKERADKRWTPEYEADFKDRQKDSWEGVRELAGEPEWPPDDYHPGQKTQPPLKRSRKPKVTKVPKGAKAVAKKPRKATKARRGRKNRD